MAKKRNCKGQSIEGVIEDFPLPWSDLPYPTLPLLSTHFSLVLTKRRGCKGQSIEGVIEDGQVVPIVHSGDPTIEMYDHQTINNKVAALLD